MIAHPSMEMGLKPVRPLMRRLSGNTMRAWTRLVDGYLKRHPLHQVHIFYHHHQVRDLGDVVMHSPQIDHAGFEIRVKSPEEDLQEVPKLLKLMESATGPRLEHFLSDPDPTAWFEDPPALVKVH